MGHPIRQALIFRAPCQRVYQLLSDSSAFATMTGAPAEIDAQPGGAFSCFGGTIVGRIIECCPGERLVQAWRATTWEPALYSVVRFTLEQDGEQTKVALHHNGFPKGQAEHLARGWYANYWDPMTRFLASAEPPA